MNLRDLKYLVTLANVGSFSKAAEACFVSQPALSIQIKKLETTLGVQLVERHHKSILLTDIGKNIAAHAQEILQRVEIMEEIATNSQDPFAGNFDLGVLPTLAPYLFPHIIHHLSTEVLAKLKIYLAEQKTEQLLIELKQGKLDAAILSLPLHEPDLISIPLFEEELLLAVSIHHSFAKKKSIKSTDLENATLLLLEEGHCLRQQALDICQSMGAYEANDFRAASLETLRNMVAANVGITLMPKLACQPNPLINFIPFSPLKPLRQVGLVFRQTTTKTILLERFASRIKEAIKEQGLATVS